MKAIVTLWSVATAIVALATLPGSFELLMLSLAAMLPRRRSAATLAHGSWRVAVVIPAHNEELSIASCIESLLMAERGDMQVHLYVIADNCTDLTAEVARAAGADVLERYNEVERGKGYALHFAFTQLLPLGYDCFFVVDADTAVAPNFLTAAAGTLRHGAVAVQACYVARNAEESTRTKLMGFSLRAFNVVRPRGRSRLGLSAGIFGNGFGLRRETLEAVPYLAASVVEDLEYHLTLVESGRKVSFVEETAVYGEMPVRGKGVETQRSRWEGGRLQMLFQNAPRLLRDVAGGKLRCLEPLLDLLLLPLAFHVALLCVVCTSPVNLVRGLGVFGLGVVLLHLLVTIGIGEDTVGDMTALASAPFYILWKLLLIPRLMRSARSDNAWVRTKRNREKD